MPISYASVFLTNKSSLEKMLCMPEADSYYLSGIRSLRDLNAATIPHASDTQNNDSLRARCFTAIDIQGGLPSNYEEAIASPDQVNRICMMYFARVRELGIVAAIVYGASLKGDDRYLWNVLSRNYSENELYGRPFETLSEYGKQLTRQLSPRFTINIETLQPKDLGDVIDQCAQNGFNIEVRYF